MLHWSVVIQGESHQVEINFSALAERLFPRFNVDDIASHISSVPLSEHLTLHRETMIGTFVNTLSRSTKEAPMRSRHAFLQLRSIVYRRGPTDVAAFPIIIGTPLLYPTSSQSSSHFEVTSNLSSYYLYHLLFPICLPTSTFIPLKHPMASRSRSL